MALLPDLLATLRVDVSDLERGLRRSRDQLDEFSAGATNASRLAAAAFSGPGGIVIAATAAAGALSPLAGLVGLLPGALAIAGAAAATLAVGLNGVGAAFEAAGDPEKYAAALARLAPAAREFVTEVRALGPAFGALRLGVQQELFTSLGTEVRQTATNALPTLTAGLTSVATAFNGAALASVAFLGLKRTLADVGTIFTATTATVGPLLTALGDLGRAFLDIAVVSSSFFPAFGQGAADATGRFALFIAEARRTGELKEFIQDGIDAFRDLFKVLSAVVEGLTGALGPFNLASGALAFLADNTETLTQVIRVLLPVLLAYRVAILAAAAVQGTLAAATGIAAAATAAGSLANFAATVALRAYIVTATFAIGVINLVRTAALALNAALLANPIGLVIIALVALVAAFVLAYRNSETFRNIVNGAFAAVRAAGQALASFVTTAIPAAFSAAVSAVGNALSGLVSLIGSLPGRARSALASLAATLAGVAAAAFVAFRNAMTVGISAAVALARGIGGRIKGGVGNLSGLLVGAGGDLLRGLANGISGAIGGVISAAKRAAQAAVSAVKGALGINSPSRVFAELGAFTGQGFALGIQRSTSEAQRALAGLVATPTVPILRSPITATTRAADAAAEAAADGQAGMLAELRALRAEVARQNDRYLQLTRSGAIAAGAA